MRALRSSPAAGINFLAPLGKSVAAGEPLFIVHAHAPGELAYAFEYLEQQSDLIAIGEAL